MRVKTPERKEERRQNAKRKHHNAPSEAEAKKWKLDRAFLDKFQGKLITLPLEFSESSDDEEEEGEEEEEEEEEDEEDDDEETEEETDEEEEEEEDKKMKSENSKRTFLGEFQGKSRSPRIEFPESSEEEEEDKKMKSEISKRTFLGEFRQIKFPETSELAEA
ncbi:hypothetical protein R3W88_032531 [Solanum pinnatisectum]|uniref:Uncharacterized protein n=1 Tax=Solanum pinnatisectum TaxID=50273 RepID=A0AAV9LPF7_9SOLN|nr:hypothetical protein R3W88_032531 [Solanum pinnatisectum]